jgi:hypothetical protein
MNGRSERHDAFAAQGAGCQNSGEAPAQRLDPAWRDGMKGRIMQQRQRGMSMLEVLAILALGTLVFAGLTEMIDVSLEDAKGQQAAHQQEQVASAARKYMATETASLLSSTTSAVVAVTVANLKTAGLLSNSFATINSYGQNTCALVRQPTPGTLEALVVTYGGQAIPDKNIAAVAMGAGRGAGYITSASTGAARGPSWALNDTTPYRGITCAGSAQVLTGGAADGGHLVSNIFYDGPGQRSTEFLYRDNVGRPELNQMNTPLRMNGASLVTAGDPCGAQPAVAIDNARGDAVVCVGGVWKNNASSWRPPVASFAALGGIGGNVGDVRLTLDNNRAFAYDGSNWVALAVDQDGNLRVPKNMHADTIRADNDVQALTGNVIGVDLVANRDIRAARNISASRDIEAGNGVSAIWMNSGSYEIEEIVGPGSPCNYASPYAPRIQWPTGTLAVDNKGIPLSCYTDGTFRYLNGTYAP